MNWWQWILLYLVIAFPTAVSIGKFIIAGNPTDEDEGGL